MLSVLQSLVPSFWFYRTVTLNLQQEKGDIFAAVRIVSTFHALASVLCGVLYSNGMIASDTFVTLTRLTMSGFFAYDIVHVIDTYRYYGKLSSQVFIAHHLMALYGLHYVPNYLAFVPNLLMTEITTPFINLSWYANKRYGQVKPAWYFVNALAIVSGFAVFRVANLITAVATAFQQGETRMVLFVTGLLTMNISWTVKLAKIYLRDYKNN